MRLLSSLVFAAAMAAGAKEITNKPATQVPVFKETPVLSNITVPGGLILYAPDGTKVAECPKQDEGMKFSGCKIEPGFDLNDVMNAWVTAYLKSQQ